MAAQPVQNIAPFINVEFTVVSKWWTERVNPVTGQTEIHRGLDITTGHNDPLYSMLTGHVLAKGTTSTAGNYIIIVDDTLGSSTYGYATRYLHMRDQAQLPVGAAVQVGQQVGVEGTTGQSTGIHLHLEMQDVSRFNWQWHVSNTKSDYLDPTIFMGIDNEVGTHWIYDGTPVPPTPTGKKKKGFPWVLYARSIRNRNNLSNK